MKCVLTIGPVMHSALGATILVALMAISSRADDAVSDAGKAEKMGQAEYFPPPESAGGWRTLTGPEDIRPTAGMEPKKLDALRQWLLESDNREFSRGHSARLSGIGGRTRIQRKKRPHGAWHRSRRPSVQPCFRSPLNRADWD